MRMEEDEDGNRTESILAAEMINTYDLENNQYNIFMWEKNKRMERKIISALEHKGTIGEFSDCDDGGTATVD